PPNPLPRAAGEGGLERVGWRLLLRRAAGEREPKLPSPAHRGGAGGGGRRLLLWALVIEAFLLALYLVAPLGGVSLSVSPLAVAWPWLLAPARLVFDPTLVDASIPAAQGWRELAALATLLVGASCAAAVAVGLARRVERADRRWLWLALGVTAALGLTLALLPTLPSDDVFAYTLYGRISALHHANPLVSTPADFPHDPFLSLVYWQQTRSVYGPVWLLLSGWVALLAQALGGGLVAYVALFKALGALTHLANTALVWLILGRIAPRRRLAGTLLYGWNPLCLLEFCASAHNDAVMLFFLLLGVYAIVCGRDGLGMLALALSISTKLVPIALLPFYLVYCGWRLRAAGAGWRAVVSALAWRVGVVALVSLALIAPFWAGPKTFGALLFSPPAQQLDNSLLESISWPLRWLAQGALGLSAAQARTLVETGLKLLALLAFALLWLWEMRRTRTLEGTWLAWGWALVWYALVASGWFWPWYVTWAVAVAAFAPWGRLQTVTQALAGGALTIYGFLPLQSSPVYGYRSLVAFGPALAFLFWWLWRDTRAGAAPWTQARELALAALARWRRTDWRALAQAAIRRR
ncbi:MAG: hypothetical protein KGO05_00545, partial [Chloroflexota bacterium]|nr:hypothetical protein [Chloroflexota bacterium]